VRSSVPRSLSYSTLNVSSLYHVNVKMPSRTSSQVTQDLIDFPRAHPDEYGKRTPHVTVKIEKDLIRPGRSVLNMDFEPRVPKAEPDYAINLPIAATIVPAVPAPAVPINPHVDPFEHEQSLALFPEGAAWDVHDVEPYTTRPVISPTPMLIEYMQVFLQDHAEEDKLMNLQIPSITSMARLLRRDVVQTFLRDAGCVVLQPFEDKTALALRNIRTSISTRELINSLPSKRITQESEKVVLKRPELQPGFFSKKDWPVYPITGSELSLQKQVIDGPSSVIHIKPDVLRWRICHIRLGRELTERLFECFTSKYNIFLLPKKNSTDRTWARSEWECKYVAKMQIFTCGIKSVRDDVLGYEHLPLLQLEGFFTSEACWWFTKEASAALIAQDYLANMTSMNVPFDAFEAMALTNTELRYHFPIIDRFDRRHLNTGLFPKMRSLASYYYSNQLSHPHGLHPKHPRRLRLQFAHERETYIFVLQAVWHNWKHGRRLFNIPKKPLDGMFATKLNEVPKELLGLPSHQ